MDSFIFKDPAKGRGPFIRRKDIAAQGPPLPARGTEAEEPPCLVQNDSGAAQEAWTPLEIADVVIADSQNQYEYRFRPIWSGITATESSTQRIVVLQEPLGASLIGRGRDAGRTLVRLKGPVGLTHASLLEGETVLTASNGGPCAILFDPGSTDEEDPEAERLALVRLGTVSRAYLIRIPCGETIPAASNGVSGRVRACLFTMDEDGVHTPLLDGDGHQRTEIVFNPFEQEIGDGCWLPIVEESSGLWILTTPDCPVTQTTPEESPDGFCKYLATLEDDFPVWEFQEGECDPGYECDPPESTPTLDQVANGTILNRPCASVAPQPAVCQFEARTVSALNAWVLISNGCGRGRTCDPPPRRPTDEQVANADRATTSCRFNLPSGPSPSFCVSTVRCRWQWSAGSNRWNPIAGDCYYQGNPDPLPGDESSFSFFSDDSSTSSLSSSSLPCACVIYLPDDEESSGSGSPSSSSDFSSDSSFSSFSSVSENVDCRCAYPTFCGTFDGECTYTSCTVLDIAPPEECPPEEDSSDSSSTFTSLDSSECVACFADVPPCDCVCHWRAGFDRQWHIESIDGNAWWDFDEYYNNSYLWARCYNCHECPYPGTPPHDCGGTTTTSCYRTTVPEPPQPSYSCSGSCFWYWLFWDPGWRYHSGNCHGINMPCGCHPPSEPGPEDECAGAVTPCGGPPPPPPPPKPCACHCAPEEESSDSSTPAPPENCEGTCTATYDLAFTLWAVEGSCGEDCECAVPTDTPSCAETREVPCLPILPPEESSNSSSISFDSSDSAESSGSESTGSSGSAGSSGSGSTDSSASSGSESSDSSSLSSSPESSDSGSSSSPESSSSSVVGGCEGCCLIGEFEWTGQYNAVNDALAVMFYNLGINRTPDDEGQPCDPSDQCAEVSVEQGPPSGVAGHVHKGIACIQFIGTPIHTVVITITLEVYDTDPPPTVLLATHTQVITLSVDPEMPCETTEEFEDFHTWVVESNTGTQLIHDIEVSTIGMICN